MLFFKNDEEKRSKAFTVITLAAIIVIVLIASFFLRKIYTDDPLKGAWIFEESDLTFDFDGGETVTIVTSDEFDGTEVQIPMKYSLDRDLKLVSITINSDELNQILESRPESVGEEEIREFAESMEQSYEYSVDNKELTLTEGDGGEQKIFYKK